MKFFLTTAIASLLTFTSFAQDWSRDVYKYKELYPGYVITIDGDKMEGFIRYTNRVELQSKVEFYKDKNDKKSKIKFKTQDLIEYQMADKKWDVIHYSGGLFSKPLRGNLLVNDACIAEYIWYDKAETFSTMRKSPSETYEEFDARLYPSVQVFLKDGAEKPVTLSAFTLSFKKKMLELVGDNEEIAEKVGAGAKGYKLLSLYSIIEEYNQKCAE